MIVIKIQLFIFAVVDKSSNSPDIFLTLESIVFKFAKIFLAKGEGRIELFRSDHCHVLVKTVSILEEFVHALSDIRDIE